MQGHELKFRHQNLAWSSKFGANTTGTSIKLFFFQHEAPKGAKKRERSPEGEKEGARGVSGLRPPFLDAIYSFFFFRVAMHCVYVCVWGFGVFMYIRTVLPPLACSVNKRRAAHAVADFVYTCLSP